MIEYINKESDLPTHKWVMKNFPSNYQELEYIETTCSNLSIISNKHITKETINFVDKGLYCIFKSIRDEPKEFLKRIKKVKLEQRCLLSSFKKNNNADNDYFETGFHEFVIRKISRRGKPQINDSKACLKRWEKSLSEISSISERLKDAILLNSSISETLNSWDDENSLIFIHAPDIIDEEYGKRAKKKKGMSVDDHVKLLKLAINSKGKLMILSKFNALYNRYLSNWNNTKRIFIKNDKKEAIWFNF